MAPVGRIFFARFYYDLRYLLFSEKGKSECRSAFRTWIARCRVTVRIGCKKADGCKSIRVTLRNDNHGCMDEKKHLSNCFVACGKNMV